MSFVTNLNRYRKTHLTAAQRRVIEELREHGSARCVINEKAPDWTWKIQERVVTRPLYALANKGWVKIQKPQQGAKAYLIKE